jgi:thiamine pyrophosphokinase
LRAIIFANGELKDLPGAKSLITKNDRLLAADGGARHCISLGFTPHVLIGDMDSLSEQDVLELAQTGTKVIRHQSRKDETDLELAFLYALDEGAEQALVLGGLGRRWDQTIANLLLPAYHRLRQLQIVFLDCGEWLYLVEGERVIEGRKGLRVSLIPLGGDAKGVSSEGLEYPLHNETLYFGATRGISNVMLGRRAQVSVHQGVLLCIVGARE